MCLLILGNPFTDTCIFILTLWDIEEWDLAPLKSQGNSDGCWLDPWSPLMGKKGSRQAARGDRDHFEGKHTCVPHPVHLVCSRGPVRYSLLELNGILIVSSHPSFPEYLYRIHSSKLSTPSREASGSLSMDCLSSGVSRLHWCLRWELGDADGSHSSSVPIKHLINTHVMPAWACVCFPALQYDKGLEHPPQTHLWMPG